MNKQNINSLQNSGNAAERSGDTTLSECTYASLDKVATKGGESEVVNEPPDGKIQVLHKGDPKSAGLVNSNTIQMGGGSNVVSSNDVIENESSTPKPSSVSSIFGLEDRQKVKRNKKKTTQRMRPKSHSPMRTAAATWTGQPQMDLRHILKKYEKKADTTIITESSDVVVGFFGSLSSIPFLHPQKEEKKTRKGKRNKTKQGTESVDKNSEIETSTTVENSRNGIVTENVELWKSMCVQDANFMEEVSHRPNDVLPLRKTQSLRMGATATQHPGELVEHAGETMICPTFMPEGSKRCPSFSDVANPVSDPVEEELNEGRNSTINCPVGQRSRTQAKQNVSDIPVLQLATAGLDTASVVTQPTTNFLNQEAAVATSTTEIFSETILSIAFQDGCVISGTFHPKEQVRHVIDGLRKDILRNDKSLPDFDLYGIKSHNKKKKERLCPESKLLDLGLVPRGEVFVKWRMPLTEDFAPGWYLRSNT
ncbi:hypothetical protein IV203_031674 [Nitzschia inconspicua]|uniref:Uncharacterized protein n=1 Tax=Nitzschia inconspicua TaxID=303405 RepID=A0A9K3LXL0_9STRA|nr:hypothetical protein IV203_031674 [Nitzschia inconspicua]